MNHTPANALFHALNKIAQPPLPTWAEYQSSWGDTQHAIRVLWCAIGHGYQGDGSQRREAFDLYNRACIERAKPRKVIRIDRGEDDYDGDFGRGHADYMEGR